MTPPRCAAARARAAAAPGLAAALALAAGLWGCDTGDLGAPTTPGTAQGWFTLEPGVYRDYQVTELGIGVRYLRVTLGAPETFFGRSVTPWVYGAVPGLPPDTLLLGLRQYFSFAPDGALWFHGAENRGFASHTDPPVRQLLPRPGPEQAWTDTVRFTSYFPGGEVFLDEREAFAWTTSKLARIVLPAGAFDALRSASDETSLDNPGALPLGRALLADPVPLATVPADSVPAHRGTWFGRHRGPVAIDWPSGPTVSGFFNSTTFELMGQGRGPLPPRRTVWEDTLAVARAPAAGRGPARGRTQAPARIGPASVIAAGSSGSPQMRSGFRTRSRP